MQAFLKTAWQRRLAALSFGGLFAAAPLLAQSTVPEIPPTPNNTPPVAQPPAVTPPALTPPVTPQPSKPQPTLDKTRPGLLDAIEKNRATREAARDDRQDAREQNRDNRANSIEPAARRDDRQERRDDRRERALARLGFAFDAAAKGLTVSNLQPNSVFGTAGFRNNDVILRVGDRRFTDNTVFYNWLSTVQPGQPLGIVVLRDGRETTINWTPTEQWVQEYNSTHEVPVTANTPLGITLDAHQPQAAIVVEVDPGSLADRAGIRPRDQIVSFNGEKINNAKEFHNWAARVEANSPLDIGFSRVVSLHAAAKPVIDITVPVPERRDVPGVLPMPVTPRAPQPNPPRIDPSQANPGVTPVSPR